MRKSQDPNPWGYWMMIVVEGEHVVFRDTRLFLTDLVG